MTGHHKTGYTFFAKGLVDSSKKSYGSSQRRYLHFCEEANLPPLPASEKVLCYFATFLAKEKLKIQDHEGLA